MTDAAKRQAGIMLTVVAVVLALTAIVLWKQANRKAAEDRIEAGYDAAFGHPREPVPADHTVSLVIFGGVGVAAIGAFIMMTSRNP